MDPADVTEALGVAPERIGGRRQWWLRAASPERHELARSLGLRAARRVVQLRVPLPLLDAPPVDLELHAFRPGVDDAEWLEVNRRAFATHPDQGLLEQADLDARMAEPWFDPSGFLVHRDEDGSMDGFCWTREHRDGSPEMGEIYVIGVRPDRHGLGLGRQLTVAGLDHLAGRGLEVGMLYAESDNTAALGLYEQLGFTVHHEDVAYE